MKKVAFYIFLLLFFMQAGAFYACARPDAVKRARELMAQAMKARDKKNIGLARAYFLQAKKLHPSLPVPVWLKKDFRIPENEEEELELFLRLTHSLPYPDKKELYAERVGLSPGNLILRSKLLELARNNNDKREVQRHKTAINTQTSFWKSFKKVVIWIIYLLIFYNAWKIFADLRSKKTQPEKQD
jgi:hypothetical protein